MESAVLGVALDSSIVIAAERRSLSVPALIRAIVDRYGDIDISIPAIVAAELIHGIYRAKSPEVASRRRRYVEALLASAPVHPMTERTAWIVGRIEGQEAARGNVLPLGDLLIAASAIELGYAVLTGNVRHFEAVPGLRVLTL